MGSKILPRAGHAGLVVLVAACSSGQASEQHSDIVQRYTSLGSPAGADMGMQVDTAVAGVLRIIDPAETRATDSTLVAFGTRHTLSDTLSDTRGNGAARRYLHAKLEGYSKDCGGCLKVG